MLTKLYDLSGEIVVCAEFFDPYPHYVEIFTGRAGTYGGFDEINSTSLETWGAVERR